VRYRAIFTYCHEQLRLSGESQSFVHDCLIVTNNIDTCWVTLVKVQQAFKHQRLTRELGKALNEHSECKAVPPLRHLEHNQPTGRRRGLFGIDGHLDLLELGLNPVFVCTVKMQLFENGHAFLQAIGGDEMSWGLGEPQHTDAQQYGRESLESEGESPLERGRVRHVMAAVAYPRRDDETNTNHLLGETDDETSVLRTGAFGLVYRNYYVSALGYFKEKRAAYHS
jgi:hypothetical protein